jgi:PAS domain S-box-containing protein
VDWSVVTLCQNGFETVLASSLDTGDVNQTYSLHGLVTNRIIETGHSLTVEDGRSFPEYGDLPEGYRAYIGVPLRSPQGGVIGTVCSFHQQPRHFTPEDVRLAEIFAERAATAIDNYQLYQQQQQVNAQLQAEMQERQEFEKALAASEERLRQITENMHQVVWMYSHDGKPIYLSPAFEKIWGQRCQDWYENPNIWWTAVHPDDQERVKTAFYQNHDGTFEEEYRLIRPDGSVRIIRDQAFPVRDESGQIYRIAGIAEDITERKQSQQEMLKAIASLAEVGELAAMIVHELRNPLTTVLMGLNAFKRMDLPEVARERLALSLGEAERIRTLLNEILLYAKPQALQFSTLELNEFMTGLLESIRTMPVPMKRRIEFVPAPSPVQVLADKDKLKQVFINLVDNACEAVKEGEIVTWQVNLEAAANQVCIQVHNIGEPIPPEILPKLTKPFYTTKPSGTGLGLAIVRRIVDAHGGELAIASSAAEGTTVSVHLPLISVN